MQFVKQKNQKYFKGFTLIETLVGVAIFAIVAVGIYQGLVGVQKVASLSKERAEALALATAQIETIRNLSYEYVGIVNGLPRGKILREQSFTRSGINFKVVTTIRNIDDPFDGTLGGTPNDLSPADYKIAEVEVSCASCARFTPIILNTRIGPNGLETSSGNGALFIKVFDANGQPVSGASVRVVNNKITPNILIEDVTDNNGLLQIVDAPPGEFAYEIYVSKDGYSTERTYAVGEEGIENPTTPNATVLEGQVTQISFSIDKLSVIDFYTLNTFCAGVGPFTFKLSGTKFLGQDPNILKYEQVVSTDLSGRLSLDNIEWGTYDLIPQDQGYMVAGSFPLLSVVVDPDSVKEVKLVLANKLARGLLVTVKDASTGLPLSDVSVRLSGSGVNNEKITSQGFFNQTDWSDRVYDGDGNIETADPVGEIKLKNFFNKYVSSGFLVSSVFDTGATSTNFYNLDWLPHDQATSTGANNVRLQLASGDEEATSTWSFTGPDGTEGTYYSLSNTNINSSLNNKRFVRYKISLNTEDDSQTPSVSDVSLTYSSACLPFGQVFYSGLSAGDYNIVASKNGYQDFFGQVKLLADWQSYEIILNPL